MIKDAFLVAVFVALTFVCWGAYGPTLHKGQMAMGGSRLRPLLCVGIAYFAIAVVVPVVALALGQESAGKFTFWGVSWSLAGGALGAIGALGIILAFNYGGSPAYVMPFVFGFAPLINGFITVGLSGKYREMSSLTLGGMMAGLIMVSMGAFLVLFCAQKVAMHKPPQSAVAPEEHAAAEAPAESTAQ
ncbi:MAG: hypothetical protein AB7U73_09740 [Pirellulales bacterium]